MQSIEKQNKRKKKNPELQTPHPCKMTDMPSSNENNDGCVLFPIEEIVQHPLPGYCVPTWISFSPDDSLISYLFSSDKSLNRKLFMFDVETRKHEVAFSPPDGGIDESNISAEEKLRRERMRERGLGVTRYEWVKTGSVSKTIMVPLPTGIYFQDLSHQPELKLPSTASSPIIDPHLSPDGSMLAYVRDYELHVLNLSDSKSKQLTFGADGNTIVHGLAEYIAQEEMDRKYGYWWSMDGKYIAYTETDSSEIPLYRIMHQGKRSVGLEAQEDHAYPFAGASNVKVRLGVVSIYGGPTTWMDLQCGGVNNNNSTTCEDEYLARVNWIYGNILIAQVLNRSQTKLKLVRFNIENGEKSVIMVEELEPWINLHDCFTPLDKGVSKSSPGFIWASERTGFRHLYIYDIYANTLCPITKGDWMVEQITGVNEAMGLVYFTGTLDSPLESHLYCAKLYPNDDLAPQKLTRGNGRHVVVLDHQLQRFVDIHDSLDSLPRISLRSLQDGSLIMHLYEQEANMRVERLELEPPKIVKVETNDGEILYGALYKPDENKFGPPPYKTLINVYGGPSVQLVCDSWMNTVDMKAQFLRSKGVLVWKMDNRGSARRGLKFEGALKNKAGQIDAEDQLTGAQYLIKQGLAKPSHIGIYGWSYGGYLSAMSLSRFPDTFRCAVSGAPVTSWDGYDTFYTEKYMGLLLENKQGYKLGSVMNYVEKMKGKLLLVHGMIDENVHFRHTARLINKLISERKMYELLIFPDERHMPRRTKDRIYMEERIWEFIERNL